MKLNIFFFLFVFFFLHFFSFAQEVPPHWQFVTVKSPHFDVIINAKQQQLGQFYANQLEKIYNYTRSFISEHPERTIVIINDKWDITNGYATRIPYPHIMIYPVLPAPGESLSETGDWTLELLAHEYTHILNFEPAPGVMGGLRSVFGSVLAPNILLPSWWKEGVAVQVESSISSGGRLRSAYQDAAIRALVLHNQLEAFDLAQINEVLPSWPEGMRPYLFGSIMWNQMVAEHGPHVIEQFFQRQGGRAPYFIETPAQDYLGKSYSEEYELALAETKSRAQKQIETLKSQKITEDFPIQIQNAEYASSPSISANGRYLAIITKNNIDERSIQIIERNRNTNDFINGLTFFAEEKSEEGSPQKVFDGPPSGSIARVSWFHNSNKIIYDKIDSVNSVEKYSDLYIFDLESKKTTTLTKRIRAREPAVSPLDNRVVFISLGPNNTGLSLVDLGTKKISILIPGQNNQRISHPNFLDEDNILFSKNDESNNEDLWIYNIKQKSQKKFSSGFARARFVEAFKEKIFFTSSENGVHNIYAYPSQALTNSLTSFFSFSVDPVNQDIYATKMTERGPWVVKITSTDLMPRSSLPKIASLYADRLPARNSGPVYQEKFPVEEYSVGNSLWPKYWIPFFATTSQGLVLQALTSGFDPLKKHQYSIAASWDTYLNKGSFSGSYLNNVWSLPWYLRSSIVNTYFASASNSQTTTSYSAGVSPSLFSLSRYLSTNIGYSTQSINSDVIQYKRMGPELSILYSDVSQAGEQISPENSKALYIGGSFYSGTGDYLNHEQYLISGTGYLSKWLPERHALMLKVSGIYTPEKIASSLGATSASLIMSPNLVTPQFVMRGYLSGHFVGRNMINTNLEYRFPILKIEKGSGTDAYFLRRLHGAFIVDGITTEGAVYNSSNQLYYSKTFADKFWGLGGELKLETTLGYVLPLSLVLYYYQPSNKEYGGSGNLGFSVQMAQAF